MSLSLHPRAGCCCGFGIALCVLLWSMPGWAEVIVVTDSQHAVKVPENVRVILLDLPMQIEAELTAGLSAHPQRSAAMVQQRMQYGGSALQQRIAASYQGVVDAWSLGVTKLPAVVVDQQHVVYGEPDVARAVARIEAYRREQP